MLCPRKYMAHHYICKYRIGNGLSLTACFCSNDCRTPDTIPPQAAPMGRTGGPRNFLRRPSRPSRKRDGFAWFLAPLLSEARLALGEATPGPDGARGVPAPPPPGPPLPANHFLAKAPSSAQEVRVISSRSWKTNSGDASSAIEMLRWCSGRLASSPYQQP